MTGTDFSRDSGQIQTLPLPDEIWILIGNHLCIDEIQTLIGTCRTLRDILQNSKSVWVEAVNAVLAVTPNGAVRRILSRANTSAQLRSLAFRYSLVDRALSAQDLSSVFKTSEISLSASFLDALLIQGSAILLQITVNGIIHMTSIITGKIILSWYPPELFILEGAAFATHFSPSVGMVLMVKIKPKNPSSPFEVQRIWLFQVTTSTPTLARFFDSGTIFSVADCSMYDDTFLIIREEDVGILFTLVSIPSVFTEHPDASMLSWTHLPQEKASRAISQVISRTAFALFGASTLEIFALTDDTSEPRRQSFSYPEVSDTNSLRFGCLTRSEDATSLTFSVGRNAYTLRIPHSLKASNIVMDMDYLLPEGELSFGIRGLRYCSTSTTFQSMDYSILRIRIHTSYVTDTYARRARLRERVRPETSSLELRLAHEAELFDLIEFDEWAGIVVVVTSRYIEGEFDKDYATIFALDGLENYVRNLECV